MTSESFENLEKRCKKLSIKLYVKIFIISLTTIILIYLFYNFNQITDVFNVKTKEKRIPKKSITSISHKVLIKDSNKSVKQSVIQKQKKKITNSTFQKKRYMQITYDTIYLKPTIELPDIIEKHKPKTKTKPIKKSKMEKETSISTPIIKDKKSIDITIKPMKKSDILSKKISKNDNYISLLNLAKYYFIQKEYKKAIFYSKKASKKAPTKKEPWLIYIKSKIALGKISEAKKVIKTFLAYFSSKEAEELLKKLENKK